MAVFRERKGTSIDKHPLFIGLLVGTVGAAAGYFAAINAAKTQADAVIRAAQLQIEQDRHDYDAKAAEQERNRGFNPNKGGTRHQITLKNWGIDRSIDSKYEDGSDYWIRPEGCYAGTGTQVYCVFTIIPKKTITVTNIDNNSRGYRRDGTILTTCCIYEANIENSGAPVYAPGEDTDEVKRFTIQPGEAHIFLLIIPDFVNGSLPDSVLFSRGQNDKGVEFSIELGLLHWGKTVSISQKYAGILFKSESDEVIGNKNGSQKVVEFTDYQCQACRDAEPKLQKFLADHSDVRLIVKDFPILDHSGSPPVSHFAAIGALAAAEEGRYAQVRAALLTASHLSRASVLRILATNGIAANKFADLGNQGLSDAHLAENVEIAKYLGILGVPTFIYNGRIYGGFDEFNSDYTISTAPK